MTEKKNSQLEIFLESQEKLNNEHLIKALKSIYSSTPFDDFWNEFRKLILSPLSVFNREPAVEKVIDFIAKFVISLALELKISRQKRVSENNEEEDDSMHPLLMKLFYFLLDIHRSKEKAVRFRTCQLVSKLLINLEEDAQIEDDLFDRIYQCMIERLRDKVPIVRVHAVLALKRLQTPLDETCPITKAFIILMSRDAMYEVRNIVLTSIAVSKLTLPAIIERTYDVHEKVRKTAYTVIAEKIPVKALTIEQRVQLLQNGLNDRSDIVKAACAKQLLQSWLCAFQGNILELLSLLDVQSSVAICETALTTLFKSSSILNLVQKFDILNEKAMIDREKLSCESSFYWRNLLQFIYNAGLQFEEQLDQLRPVCVEFCAYVQSFTAEMTKCNDVDQLLDLEFVLQQLLQIISVMDLSDQASRKEMEKMLHNLLVSDSVGPSLIPHILTSLKLVYNDIDNLIKYIAETVSEIREPITSVETQISAEERRQLDKKVASIRVKLHQLREELSFCIEKQEFEKAAQIKSDIANLDSERSTLLGETEARVEEVRIQKNDYFTMLKCLTIVCELLIALKVKTFSPSLQALMDSQILPGMTNLEADIRNAGVKAIGLCCLVTKDIVMQHLPVLMQASQVDSMQVRATALKVLFDIFHVYGSSAFSVSSESSRNLSSNSIIDDSQNQEEDETSPGQATEETSQEDCATKILALLSSNLDSENPDLRYIAAEGICKLLQVDRIVSSKLISHLVLLWYNPLIEEDVALIQILGTFFTMYAFSNSAHQVVIEEAFIPTLLTVLHAPRTSPLSEINEVNLANFLIEIIDSWHLAGNKNLGVNRDNPCHDSLAVKLCNRILSDTDSFDNKLWLHTLTQLNISPDNIPLIENLLVMTEDMNQAMYEKSCCKLIAKLKSMLTFLLDENKKEKCSTGSSETVEARRDVDLLAEETTNDAFENLNQTVNRRYKKQTKTPSIKAKARSAAQSELDDSVFTPMRPQLASTDIENTRVNLENLFLTKTPAGKTPKRHLFSAQESKLPGSLKEN
ncbi:condensin complex subunit 3 [Biomphalaria pfeifferi]|uniref:Condensin complex subunit 3 n=1 Tax=Biomphalaria pfeifferi TaxID=112525 RepID=A0AAD8F2K0_BIOPF|nr:condensin complex subunit 3 [Biomphalaria pfeifferi]